jgi:hypothetical protein
MKKKSQQGTQDFNVENPLQQREVKIHGRQPAKLHYIGSVYKHHWLSYDAINPSRRLTRSIYRLY